MIGPEDILFMGLSRTHLAWYRCFSPALRLGCDWCGVVGNPPDYHVMTSYVRGAVQNPKFSDYKVIVVQQPGSPEWASWIFERQQEGIKVLFEIDDDLHAVAKMDNHPNAKIIRKKLKHIELCMRMADGVIVSTPALLNKYSKHNENMFLCENGIDFDRYQLTRPKLNGRLPIIGWAGGIGNEDVLQPWLPDINLVAREHFAQFISVSVPYAQLVYGGIHIPFAPVECWPGVLSNFDITLAPAKNNNFYRAKSQLRWIESSAMGIPVISSKQTYTSVQHRETGIQVSDRAQFKYALQELIHDEDLRKYIGENAREYVRDNFRIEDKCQQWRQSFESVVS